MAVARKTRHSDVHVTIGVDGTYNCHKCKMGDERRNATLYTKRGILAHLNVHRVLGHKVPEKAIRFLEALPRDY